MATEPTQKEMKLDYGHLNIRKGFYGGKQVSERVEVSKSFEVQDYYDLQSQLIEFAGLVKKKQTSQLTLKISTDEAGKPKRLEVKWLQSRTGV